jgi:hypothetical protein
MESIERNKVELERVIQGLKPVPGTFPPVYMCGNVLIGYDKLEQVRILADTENESLQTNWLYKLLNTIVKSLTGTKFL